jgi:hypothetical protein
MNRLVGDLLDYTRTRFGDGIPIIRVETDARQLINDVVSETRAAHPDRLITVRPVRPFESPPTRRQEKSRFQSTTTAKLSKRRKSGRCSTP